MGQAHGGDIPQGHAAMVNANVPKRFQIPHSYLRLAVTVAVLLIPTFALGGEPLVGEARNNAIAKLGAVYGELASLNQIFLSDMEVAGKAKDVPTIRAVFARKEKEFESRAAELLGLAQRVPDTELARDAAILILNTTYYNERDGAIDLLLEYHIESPRMREAVTCLGYTSRRSEIVERVLRENKDNHVHAHCRQVQADTWMESESKRPEAKEVLYDLLRSGEGIPFHRGGAWGPGLPKRTVSEVASLMLRKINARDSVQIGQPLANFSGKDLTGNPVSISSYRGKVTLVVFWATWCGPCMKLAELEKKLVQRYAGLPFDILGVCGDAEVTPDVIKIATEHGMTWTSLHDSLDGGQKFSEAVGLHRWPFVILLDREGTVADTALSGGVTDRPDLQEAEFCEAIEKLLPEFKPTKN